VLHNVKHEVKDWCNFFSHHLFTKKFLAVKVIESWLKRQITYNFCMNGKTMNAMLSTMRQKQTTEQSLLGRSVPTCSGCDYAIEHDAASRNEASVPASFKSINRKNWATGIRITGIKGRTG
jgi:hypothetical protein